MSIKSIAKLIPQEIRSEVLLTDDDIIFNAVSVKDNKNMQTLLTIWHAYVEPNKEVTNCPICIGNILTNFRQMKNVLIELENEYQKLNSL